MITLKLTSEQAEVLGYALTMAKRREVISAAIAPEGSHSKIGRLARITAIEDLRTLLDNAPETHRVVAAVMRREGGR